MEPIIAPNFPIHVSFPLIIGGGGLALNDDTWHDYEWEYDDYEPYDWDSYFVLEPGVEVELNLVKFLGLASALLTATQPTCICNMCRKT